MERMTTIPPTLPHGVARLEHLGVIQIEGEDATRFIHGQLTQDFALLASNEARLAALCSPKGRMLASFIGFKRSNTDILLLCSHDVLAPMLKRLSMFVLRAKARLVDASDAFTLYGRTLALAPETPPPWALQQQDQATVIYLYPALGVARQLWVCPKDAAAPVGEPLEPALWQWSEVRSGVATVSAPLTEAFVPQMLNYESIGGVSFKKGCYPGQEVVARSQFRGTLKRRAYIAHASVAMAAGQALFATADPDQSAGTVVQAAPNPSGGWDAIVSLQTSAAVQAPLHLQHAQGPQITLLPLPYGLLEDV